MHVRPPLGVPEEKPVLLYHAIRRLPLQLRAPAVRKGLARGRRTAHVRLPAGDQPAEILDPLPKAREAAVAAVHDKGDTRAVKDARVVRANVEREEAHLLRTLGPVGDGVGGLDGQLFGFAKAAAVCADARQRFVDEFGVAGDLERGLEVARALGDNDPGGIAVRVREDVWVEGRLAAELDAEELAV